MSRRTTVLVVLSVFLLAHAAGCGKPDAGGKGPEVPTGGQATVPGESKAPATPPPAAASGAKASAPDDDEPKVPSPADVSEGPASDAKLKLTAKELRKATLADPEAYLEAHKDDRFELTGVVTEVGRAPDGGKFIALLWVDKPDDEITPTIQCVTSEPAPWATAKPGQTVRLEGTLGKSLFGLGMSGCKILKVAGTPWKTRTAEELSKALQADGPKTVARFGNRTVPVKGEIESLKPDADGFEVTIKFKTPAGAPEVYVRALASIIANLKPGDEATFYAAWPGIGYEWMQLNQGTLIDPAK